MATPIRWDTIRGPSLAEASRPMDAASNSFNNAFAQLGQVLAQKESLDAANWQNQKANNTNSFLDAVARYRTPEALQAAQASGELDALRSRFGSQIDASAVRGAADTRMASLMDQTMRANTFTDAQRDRTEAPIMDQIGALTAAGKFNEANALLAQHNLRKEAPLVQALTQAGRDRTVWGQHDASHALDQRMGTQKITNMADELRHAREMESQGRARIGLEGQRLAIDKENAKWQREDRTLARISTAAKVDKDARNAAYEAVIKNSPLDQGTINTTAGKETLMKALKATGAHQDQIEDFLYNLNKNFSKGAVVGIDDKKNAVLSDIPVSVALDAFNGATGNPIEGLVPGWSRRGDDAAAIIKDRMLKDISLQRAIAAVEEAQSNRRNPNLISDFRQTITASGGGGARQTTAANPIQPKIGDVTVHNGNRFIFTAEEGWTPESMIPKKK